MRVQEPIQDVLLFAAEPQPFCPACWTTQTIFGPWWIGWCLNKFVNMIGRYEVVFPSRVSHRAKRWVPLSAVGCQIHANAILVLCGEPVNYILTIRNDPPQCLALNEKTSLERKFSALSLDRPGIVFNVRIAVMANEDNGRVIVPAAENVVFKQRSVDTSWLQAPGAETEAASVRLFAVHRSVLRADVTSGHNSPVRRT